MVQPRARPPLPVSEQWGDLVCLQKAHWQLFAQSHLSPFHSIAGEHTQMSSKMKTALTGNAILWVVAILASAILAQGSDQAVMLIVLLVILGAVSMYLVAEAARAP